MIVTVQGTVNSDNDSAKLIAILSALGVAKDKKSALVLPFVNRTRKSPEMYLIGANLRIESFVKGQTAVDITTGIDALLGYAGKLTKSAFEETTRKLVGTDSSSIYNLAFTSNEADFEKRLLENEKKHEDNAHGYIETILRAAEEVYDIVYVLVPSTNVNLAKKILQFADVNIVCVPQGKKEDITLCSKRNFIVVSGYTSGSKYSSKVIAKDYNQKIVYGMFHSYRFNDACEDGTLVKYTFENANVQKNDPAYIFMHNIEIIYNTIVGNSGKVVEDVDPDNIFMKYDGIVYEKTEWEPITERIVTEVEKVGTIKKYNIYRTDLEPRDDYEDDGYQDEESEYEHPAYDDAPSEDSSDIYGDETASYSPIPPEKPEKKKGSIFGRKKDKKNKRKKDHRDMEDLIAENDTSLPDEEYSDTPENTQNEDYSENGNTEISEAYNDQNELSMEERLALVDEEEFGDELVEDTDLTGLSNKDDLSDNGYITKSSTDTTTNEDEYEDSEIELEEDNDNTDDNGVAFVEFDDVKNAY